MKTYTIDASGKKLGRVATEAATLLMGKNTPYFSKNRSELVSISIINASKADIRDKKMRETEFKTYSGYPGGLKTATMKQIAVKKGYSKIFRQAIRGMIPTNKLKTERMKNLSITE